MNFFLLAAVLAAILATASAQNGDERQVDKDSVQVESSESIASSNNEQREKRGFILTPLSALSARALAPILPLLRTTIPEPLLTKVAPLLPSAQLIEAGSSPQLLGRILTATAPLPADRTAVTAAALPVAPPVVPAPQVLPVSRFVLPTARSVVPAQPVVAAARLVAAPTPVVATSRLITSPNVVATSRLALPTAPQIATTGVVSFGPNAVSGYPTYLTSARLAAPTSSILPTPGLSAVPFAPGVSSYYTVAGNIPSPVVYSYAPQYPQVRSAVATSQVEFAR